MPASSSCWRYPRDKNSDSLTTLSLHGATNKEMSNVALMRDFLFPAASINKRHSGWSITNGLHSAQEQKKKGWALLRTREPTALGASRETEKGKNGGWAR